METQYLIAHIGHTIKAHEHITWWNPDSRGYTICIDKAGLYDEADARSNCSTGSCIAVEKHIAEQFAMSTPYYRRQDGRLAKLYDGGPHRPVPNSREAWQYLMSGRLHGCAHPYVPPTPISVKKARAIYIDLDTALPDAGIIAAAPDLLDALLALRKAGGIWPDLLPKVDAAIAKAAPHPLTP